MNHKLLLILGLLFCASIIIIANVAEPVVAGDASSSMYIPLIMNHSQSALTAPVSCPPGAVAVGGNCATFTPTSTSLVTPTLTSTAIPSSTQTALPPPGATPTTTPAPTITPNIPPEITALATAKPPKGFATPAVQIASLAFKNETQFTIKVVVNEGIQRVVETASRHNLLPEHSLQLPLISTPPDTLIISPGGQVERQLAPGIYSYSITIQDNAWPGQVDTVELKDRTRVVISISNGTLAFANTTDISIRISLPATNSSFLLTPHTVSPAKTLPPGNYLYTVAPANGNNLFTSTGQATVELNSALTITISAANLKAALALQNLTQFEATMLLSGLDQPIVAPPGTTSPAHEIVPGTYPYTIQFTNANVQPIAGSLTLEPGYIYTYTVTLDQTQAEVTIVNETGCLLTINLTGPQNLSTTVPTGQNKTITIISGTYQYVAAACGASLSGKKDLQGKSTWTFSLGSNQLLGELQ